MAAFRYPFDVQSTLEPWRQQLGHSFDQVVATLSDRDRSLEDALNKIGVWTPYTPVWTGTGGTPAIGNGLLIGRYTQIGRTIHGQIYHRMGSTTTFGGGVYLWSLPVTASGTLFVYQAIGTTKAFDASTSNSLSTTCTVYGGDSLNNKLRVVYSTPGGTENSVGATTPWTWAVSDDITWQFTYEAAA